MTTISGPFATGSSKEVNEALWSVIVGAACPDGVVVHPDSIISKNKMAVSADNSILGVFVATGYALVRGHLIEVQTTHTVTLAAADATNPRIDLIVAELDRTNAEVTLERVTGTPAGSPVAPALTRTNSIWQIPLAQVRVEAATALIAAEKVTDSRLYAQSVNRGTADGVSDGARTTTSTSPVDMPAMSVNLVTDGGPVEIAFSSYVYNSTSGQAIRVWAQVDGGADVLLAEASMASANQTMPLALRYFVTPAAGRHTFKIRWSVSANTGNVVANRFMAVQEFR